MGLYIKIFEHPIVRPIPSSSAKTPALEMQISQFRARVNEDFYLQKLSEEIERASMVVSQGHACKSSSWNKLRKTLTK